MLRKVQAMLARADHPNTPVPEAETARRMASEMMEKYRIDEAMLEGAKPVGEQLMPTWRTWTVCSTESLYSTTYRDLCSLALNHFECRGVFKQTSADSGWVWEMEAVGYHSDLRMAEVLYTSIMLAFQSLVEPRVNPDLPDQVNAYVLRKAGMEGWRIAEALYGQNTKALRSKVRRMFKVEAERRGENPERLLGTTGVKDFRKDYADAFEMETWTRLSRMRTMRGEMSVGLVIMSRKEKVQEVFYDKYPQFRPTSGSNLPHTPANHGCPKCAKAQSGFCRDHSYLKPSKAKVKTRRRNDSATLRGREAARSVDLGATPDGRRLDG
jgi:hypothetical protein